MELADRYVTENVGPFRVTGYRPAVDAVRKVFDDLRVREPGLYASVKSGGMFACRFENQRPLSKHNWGIAIDVYFGDLPEMRADRQTQSGIVQVAEYFQRAGFYWAANAHGSIETAFHFEPSLELLMRWVGPL